MSPTIFTLMAAFIISSIGLILHRTHFLSTLICLEGIILSLFIIISIWSNQLISTSIFPLPIFLLTFSACEASAGLALIVAATRTHGTDHLKNLNLLQC